MHGGKAWTMAAIWIVGCGASPGGSGPGDDGAATGTSVAATTAPSADATSDGSVDDGSETGSTGAASSTGASAEDGSETGDTPAGFEPDAGFDVHGDFVHGGTITITRDGGGFGEREHATPWLFDLVAQQWLAGEPQNAYAGLDDGDPIDTAIWTDQSYYAGWDGPEHKFKYTTDATRLRHARVAAHYGNFAASPDDPKPYSKLARPQWPRTWGSHDNVQMYLSWWQRMDGGTPGYPQDEQGNGGEDKPLRFGDTELAGLGEFDITVAGLTATTVGYGNVKSWGSWPDPGAAWHRVEIFIDRDRGIADMWVDGRLAIGSNSSVGEGGDLEFRPVDDWLWAEPASDGTQLATQTWQNVTVHFLGFDDGGTTQQFAPGRNVELSEIYLDTTRARVEIADSDSWEDRPDAERTAEVCGRLLAWSDAEITVELNQGGFDALGDHWLWIVTDDGAALRVGRFTP